MNKYYIYFLSVLSGFLISLPFSYPELYFLSWIGLVPFLYAVKGLSEASCSRCFTAGTLLGATIIFSSSFWLYYPLVEFSGLPWLFAILLFVLVFILFGLIYGIWTCLFVFIKRKNISPFWLAISWTAFEYLRFRFIPALPFGFIAYTQSEFSSIVQLAEFGGIYLVVFIIMLFNGYIYKMFINKKIKYLIPVILLLIIIISVGTVRVNYYSNLEREKVPVGVVQSNLTPLEKWQVSNIEDNFNYFVEQSRSLSDSRLIVWPESSLTFDLIRNEFYRQKFYQKISVLKSSFIQAGSLSTSDGGLQKYNSSFLVDPGSKIIDRYNKNLLVPFGEYMPMSKLVERLTGITMSSELPGKEITIFQIDDLKWKTVICSEILYPVLVKKKTEEVDFIVNQSNEAWYKRGNLQEQMWTAALYRAVENRRSVLKSGNKAYGGIISADGTTVIKKHSKQLTTFSAELPVVNVKTFYQRWGDYIGYLSAIIVFLFIIIKLFLNHKVKGDRS